MASELLLFNKPHEVVCQFRRVSGQRTLADFIRYGAIYPAGRLDKDSEGLLLLTGDGQLQHRISHPRHKLMKTYWVQVEGEPNPSAIARLQNGVTLRDGCTRPAIVSVIAEPPGLWARQPPIRRRKAIPTSWLSLAICEGRNRQVRRMTAAVGLPTLRLIRAQIGPWFLGDLAPGEWRWEVVDSLQSLGL